MIFILSLFDLKSYKFIFNFRNQEYFLSYLNFQKFLNQNSHFILNFQTKVLEQ